MGTVTGLLGMAGGAGGTGFQGPQSVAVNNPVTQDQIDAALQGSQQGLTGQQGLLAALQAQNGLQNQSNVFNQLQGVANGTGPNPAQSQLAQATAANTANQAALMAGQRGTSANAGLLARQAAEQGAANQQNAALQGATLQSQQQLNALNQLGGQAANMAANQIGQTNANTVAQQAQYQGLINPYLQAQGQSIQQQSGINAANAGLAGARMGTQGAAIGGAAQGIGTALGLPVAEGGKIIKMADGGAPESAYPGTSKFGAFLHAQQNPSALSIATAPAPSNSGDAALTAGLGALGKGISKYKQNQQDDEPLSPAAYVPSALPTTESGYTPGAAVATPMEAKGGKVKALVSPGEKYLTPKDVQKVKNDGADPMILGKTVPGTPRVSGAKNSYKNDTVPAELDEGGIVLPRSVTKSKNPHWEAHKFVAALMANGGLVKGRAK